MIGEVNVNYWIYYLSYFNDEILILYHQFSFVNMENLLYFNNTSYNFKQNITILTK